MHVPAAFHADVLRMLEEDMGSAEEITLELFRQRPLLDRLLEKLAYKLRLWL